jgi:hypothetical protein
MYETPFIIFNIWLSSALDLEVFELTPKETVLGIFSDESSLQKISPPPPPK